MAQQPTRHTRSTGREASPVERWSRTKDGRRPTLHGYPRSSNSLLASTRAKDRLKEGHVMHLVPDELGFAHQLE
jgi:hypothetical protein